MFIELYFILLSVCSLFFSITIMNKQLKIDIKEQLLLHRKINSCFLNASYGKEFSCTNATLKAGGKEIYIRKPKGRLLGNEKSTDEVQDSFGKAFDDLEKQIKTYSNR